MSTQDRHPDVRNHGNVLTRPARPPDLVIRYGDQADQVADVHLPQRRQPEAAGRYGANLLTMILHGGFWRAAYGREHTAPLAEALAAAGFVVVAPEYRRTGQVGGGWPGTFDDVAVAVDRLPGLVAEAVGGLIDPDAMVLAGHSAGGHLALWAASRHRLPAGSAWQAPAGRGRYGVVALAAVSELVECQRLRLGVRAADALMGGAPERYPERYALADPASLLPVGTGVRLIHGTADDRVPHQMSVDYAARAREAGDDATQCVLLEGAGHFDVIDPLAAVWPVVLQAFVEMHPPVRRAGA
ncbi:MAG TPA: alpha/beta hydrolase [Streptosporangiaceae bacterium]|nr:alpha/beta hydrolase [Streptosporangiaceae bacterium]